MTVRRDGVERWFLVGQGLPPCPRSTISPRSSKQVFVQHLPLHFYEKTWLRTGFRVKSRETYRHAVQRLISVSVTDAAWALIRGIKAIDTSYRMCHVLILPTLSASQLRLQSIVPMQLIDKRFSVCDPFHYRLCLTDDYRKVSVQRHRDRREDVRAETCSCLLQQKQRGLLCRERRKGRHRHCPRH